MDSNVTAALPNEIFKRVLLPIIKHVAGRVHKDHDLVLFEVLVGKEGRILGGIDSKMVLLTKLTGCLNTCGNGIVPKPDCAGKHEHAKIHFICRWGCRSGHARQGTHPSEKQAPKRQQAGCLATPAEK
jgi:hypothetical protein